jgi:hypothetical protein
MQKMKTAVPYIAGDCGFFVWCARLNPEIAEMQ